MTALSAWQQLYSSAHPSPLQRLHHPLLNQQRVKLWVKRDDLLHVRISGNKWRKLKYPTRHAIEQKAQGLLSFGGAYSNHLHALAAIGQELALATQAIVRGEASSQNNPTLVDAKNWGMALRFVDRQQYRQRQDPQWLAQLSAQYPGYLLLPEGGSCVAALPGVAEIWTELAMQVATNSEAPRHIDQLILPVASGATLAGLISQRPSHTQLSAYAVLKGASWLAKEVITLCPYAAQDSGWQLRLAHHCGGYAKCSALDSAEISQLSRELGVPLEPIYSGKALLGLFRDLKAGYYPPSSQLVFLHTGGLQGARSRA
ncbi:1-aminocyclopropane-1-carboxylate deaminase/D-cysteine desulfhydrase [Oceanisphaera avium]|uniref:1-aminocyclopropane-1-carboxylate deaminase/D-cysteine desulfhydrase n=1 Tax=Oceanisphaera avium TaxID=1903694 RepID=UPI000B34C5CE|nr:pyridoxal-phosphate dependent enzyme [Oceanisphaera avium]